MNRVATALCLSLSAMALGLAGAQFLRSPSSVPEAHPELLRSVEDLSGAVTRLEGRIDELSSKHDALASRASRDGPREEKPETRAVAGTPAPAALEESVAALDARLTALESAETIHLLAQSGGKQAAKKKLVAACSRLQDPDASPEERIVAMGTLLGMRKQSRGELAAMLKEHEMSEADLAWPMIEIALDAGVDADLRGKALRTLAGMEMEEIRRPLLEIFASDDALEVRLGAFDALAWHMKDPTVRRVLRDAAGEWEPAELRSRATALSPKLDAVDRMDAARGAEEGEHDAGSRTGK